MKQMEFNALGIHVLQPSFDERIPHRMVVDMSRDDAQLDRLALWLGNRRKMLLRPPAFHDHGAEAAVLGQQIAVVLLLVSQIERLLHEGGRAFGRWMGFQPSRQAVELFRKRRPALWQLRFLFVY